jgi:hypothetical protein
MDARANPPLSETGNLDFVDCKSSPGYFKYISEEDISTILGRYDFKCVKHTSLELSGTM